MFRGKSVAVSAGIAAAVLPAGTTGPAAKTGSAERGIAEAKGNTAYEVGRYEAHDSGGNQIDHGRYLVVWKQVKGEWKLHRDIWNRSM